MGGRLGMLAGLGGSPKVFIVGSTATLPAFLTPVYSSVPFILVRVGTRTAQRLCPLTSGLAVALLPGSSPRCSASLRPRTAGPAGVLGPSGGWVRVVS